MTWNSRRNALLAAVATIILALAGGLAYTQLIRAGYYREIANENRIRVVRLPAPRGKILDRDGVELARNRPAFSISVVPADFRGVDAQAHLARTLAVETDDLTRRLRQRRTLPLEPVSISRDVDLRTISRIEERVEEFSGVVISSDPVRKYTDVSWGGHLLGYVREVSEQDKNRFDKAGGPLRGVVGATGLETQYDDLLRGVDGIGYRQMNALGQMMGAMPGYEDIPPLPGDDLRLAIDWDLQVLADSLLSEYTAGTVVAIEVKTGAVVCYVTRPGFDANMFIGGMSSAEWDALREDTLHPLLNRGIMGLYPPGSPFKLITSAAALESNVVSPRDRFSPCTGGYRLGNRVFGCWNKSGHGSLDMEGAIEQSCDVYFYQVALKFDLDRWAAEARNSGFGRPTGLDMPNEKVGVVPSTEYYDQLYGRRKWTRGLKLNIAIGQGELTTTPLQLAVYFAALANNGVAMKPHFLEARRPAGKNWVPVPLEEEFSLPCSQSTIDLLRRACRRVVEAETGTAHGINDAVVRMAGKTGTAQNPHGEDHAWFASYAPFDDPEIAVVALVENVGHGSTYAAPICFQMARAYLGVAPPAADPLASN